MSKIISVVGCRPHFCKLDPLLPQIIVWSGQHYDPEMSSNFFQQLGIPQPVVNLGKTTLGEMVDSIEKYLWESRPDLVMVYGDTNTTLAGALAAARSNVPLAHVEAGLRSHSFMLEEINRKVSDYLSRFLFAPTVTAVENLREEGIPYENIYLVGDTTYDTLIHWQPFIKAHSYKEEYHLLTLHRAETVDVETRLESILRTLGETEGTILFPCHPRTAKRLKEFELEIPPNIKVMEPQGYLEFLGMVKGAKKVLTDSGGVQKEAYCLKKPCITFRWETEWEETLEEGWNTLVGSDEKLIKKALDSFEPKAEQKGFLGDGTAKAQIRDILKMKGYLGEEVGIKV